MIAYLTNLVLKGFENPDVRKFRLAKAHAFEMIRDATPENLFERYHSAERLADSAFRDLEMAGYKFNSGRNIAVAFFKCELFDEYTGRNSSRARKKFNKSIISEVEKQIKFLGNFGDI